MIELVMSFKSVWKLQMENNTTAHTLCIGLRKPFPVAISDSEVIKVLK